MRNKILLVALGAALVSVVAMVVAGGVSRSLTVTEGTVPSTLGPFLLFLLGFLAGVTAICTAAVGITRSRRVGGLPAAIVLLVVSIPLTTLCVLLMAFSLFTTRAVLPPA